jgi:hypothetical protein
MFFGAPSKKFSYELPSRLKEPINYNQTPNQYLLPLYANNHLRGIP